MSIQLIKIEIPACSKLKTKAEIPCGLHVFLLSVCTVISFWYAVCAQCYDAYLRSCYLKPA